MKKGTDLNTYWDDNKTVFKLDSVSFLYIWGSLITWTIIASLCFIAYLDSGEVIARDLPSVHTHIIQKTSTAIND